MNRDLIRERGERQTLATAISSELRREIMRGDLRPGAKLHVSDLRDRFAVSLSPLREALSRLGSEGLLEIEDLRGYRVAPVSTANLTEVVRLRMELEPLALGEAIKRSDGAWGDRLTYAFQDLQRLPRLQGDPNGDEAWEIQHRRYHFALLDGCQMPMLVAFLNTLHDLSDRYRRLFLQSHAPDRDVPAEHRRIVEAAVLGETEVACALLRQHIERTGKNVLFALQHSMRSE